MPSPTNNANSVSLAWFLCYLNILSGMQDIRIYRDCFTTTASWITFNQKVVEHCRLTACI